MLPIDLHAHSNVSDGLLPPAEVVSRAHARGCRLFALTDHDDLRGLPLAREVADRLGMRFLPGVEVSVTWRKHTVHIIGLDIDPDNVPLQTGLASVRQGRDQRAVRMADALARAGIADTLSGARQYAENPEMIGRTHFARHLIDRGIAKDMQGVFRRFLAKGKPGYVPHDWAPLADAVGWIRGAGGVAVIAHPGRYEMGRQVMSELVAEFKAAGGEGIEVVSGCHNADDVSRFARLAQDEGLLASAGSDFHATGEGAREPGLLQDLPSGPEPIWRRWLTADALA